MANLHLVTGYAGREHITSADQGTFNATFFGSGQYILARGKQFDAVKISDTQVRVFDGDIYMQGRYIRLNEGAYADITIPNGTQGQNRNDLIVARYTKDPATGIEEANLVVIRGNTHMGTVGEPSFDPAYTNGDILNENATQNDIPLYRVSLNGPALEKIDKLFTPIDDPNIISHINYKNNPHGVTKEQVGLGNVPNVATNDQTPTFNAASTLATLTSGEKLSVSFGKIKKAISDLISHIGNKSNPHGVTISQLGVVPVANGGTGATTAAAALTKLGITATAAELNFVDGVTSNIQTQFNNLLGDMEYALSEINLNSEEHQAYGQLFEKLFGMVQYANQKATITTSTTFGATGITLTVPAGSYYICSGSCQYNHSNPTRITIIGNGHAYAGNVSDATNGSLSCCFANYASSDMVLELHAQYASAASNVVELKMVYFKL